MKRFLGVVSVLVGLVLLGAVIHYNPQPVALHYGLFFTDPFPVFGYVDGGAGAGATGGGAGPQQGMQAPGPVKTQPLGWVVLAAFVLGFLFSWLLDLENWFLRRMELKRLRTKNQALMEEVNNLRNRPLHTRTLESTTTYPSEPKEPVETT